MKAEQAAQPTSRMWSTDRRSGFTLIEVMAVMLIIALVASLVVTITPGTRAGETQSIDLGDRCAASARASGRNLTGRESSGFPGWERRAVGRGWRRTDRGSCVTSSSMCWARAAQAVIMATPEGSQPYRILVWNLVPSRARE